MCCFKVCVRYICAKKTQIYSVLCVVTYELLHCSEVRLIPFLDRLDRQRAVQASFDQSISHRTVSTSFSRRSTLHICRNERGVIDKTRPPPPVPPPPPRAGNTTSRKYLARPRGFCVQKSRDGSAFVVPRVQFMNTVYECRLFLSLVGFLITFYGHHYNIWVSFNSRNNND